MDLSFLRQIFNGSFKSQLLQPGVVHVRFLVDDGDVHSSGGHLLLRLYHWMSL